MHVMFSLHSGVTCVVVAEGLQAITLEDGTTAYIAHPNPEALFGEAALVGTSLNLEHLSHVSSFWPRRHD